MLSEETLQKMRTSHLGQHSSVATEFKPNHVDNPKHREKQVVAMKKKWADPNYKAKMHIAQKKSWENPERKKNMREKMSGKNNPNFGKPPECHPKWKGGKCRTADGYLLIRNPGHRLANKDGYVLEHRLIMEEKIGRHLKPNEVVHHINGDKQNNNPENLALTTHTDHKKSYMQAFNEGFATCLILFARLRNEKNQE